MDKPQEKPVKKSLWATCKEAFWTSFVAAFFEKNPSLMDLYVKGYEEGHMRGLEDMFEVLMLSIDHLSDGDRLLLSQKFQAAMAARVQRDKQKTEGTPQ